MFSFLLTATSTWALWKVLDAWFYPNGRDQSERFALPDGAALSSSAVGLALASLRDPDSRVMAALRAIAAAAESAPAVINRRVEDVFGQLTREERAAAALVLILCAQRAGSPAPVHAT